MDRAPKFFTVEQKDKQSSLPFPVLIFLSPIIFILIKIGELTVHTIILIGKIVYSIGLTLVAVLLSVVKTITLWKNIISKVSLPAAFLPWYLKNILSDIKQLGKWLLSLELTIQRATLSSLRKTKRKPDRLSYEKTREVAQAEVQEIQASLESPLQVVYKSPLLTKVRYFLSGILVGALILTPFVVKLWLSELPNPNHLALREPALSSKVYDRSGRFLFQFYANQNRTKITHSQVPKNLINATVAIEDKNFYKHKGFDALAMARAARETLVNNRIQGGSTITQQLIKSALLTPEVTVERKVKEIVLAALSERKYTKDQILEMYFNQISYGGTAWGVEAASELYFGKKVTDLDLAESALLAGLPSGPTIYSPFGASPELARKRQHEVLDRMVEEGFITEGEAGEAKNEILTFASPIIDIKAPHFVMYVKDYLVRRWGIRAVEQGGLHIITTLDLSMQEKAQQIVAEEIAKLASLSVSNGAALITSPQTGEILAMVGSRDYFDRAHDGNVNVTTSLRQPGSSIKVVTYAAALEKGLTAATVLDDSPITYNTVGSPAYSPVNYDGRFHGKVTLRDSLGNSYNVPAVKTLAQIGLPSMIDMGRRMGITTWNDEGRFGLSLTLGGGDIKMIDMATVYGVLANGGIRKDVTPILKITDSEGNVFEENSTSGRRVLSEGIAFVLSDILADNTARSGAFGPNSILNVAGKRVSVKTGTSDNKRDNWTIGFTKDVLAAVWVGNMDNGPMNPALTSGITGAAPIWSKIMTTTLADKPADQVTPPTEIVAVPVCTINGLLACGGCPTRTEYFVEGTQPKLACRPEFLTPAPAIGGAELPAQP